MKAITPMGAFIATVTLALLLACSSDGPTRTAGGTGAGNPAVLAMIADTTADTALAKRHHVSTDGNTSQSRPSSLLVRDETGLAVTITEAYVAVRRATFPAPDGTCDPPRQPQSCREEAIELEGVWVFDLITGRSIPPVDPFVLPTGTYHQVDLDLCDACDSLLPAGADGSLSRSAIILRGEFVYRDTIRHLAINLSPGGRRSFMSVGDIELTGGDTARLTIELDARYWFNDVDLVSCLDKGWFPFDGTTLTIEEGAGSGEGTVYPEEIGTKIVTSGVLKRKDRANVPAAGGNTPAR
jgi:hypothetical protein